jgi:hypothetical protein
MNHKNLKPFYSFFSVSAKVNESAAETKAGVRKASKLCEIILYVNKSSSCFAPRVHDPISATIHFRVNFQLRLDRDVRLVEEKKKKEEGKKEIPVK